MRTELLIAVPTALAGLGAIAVQLLVQRDEPAGMSHVVRESGAWLWWHVVARPALPLLLAAVLTLTTPHRPGGGHA